MACFEKSGHRPVGRDHEVLDHVRCGVLLGFLDCSDLAVVAHRSRLDGFDLQRSVLDPGLAQLTGDLCLKPELRLQLVRARDLVWYLCAVVNPVANARISELRLVGHPRAEDLGGFYGTVGADDHLHHH